MPRIETKNPEVRTYRGLHLYHAGWSNCSMRVRMVLEEKGLAWTSHHLDLRSGEHITPEYFSIHPKGVVPALVHDGETWIESNDIIAYLDEAFPEPPLTPPSGAARERMGEWMMLASYMHVSGIKTWIYGKGPATRRRKTAADLARYRELQRDEELLSFHARHNSEKGLGDEACRRAEAQIRDAFSRMDAWLAEHRWLAGAEFSLADICWAPLHYTLAKAGFDFSGYAHVERWIGSVGARRSYREAVEKWWNGPS